MAALFAPMLNSSERITQNTPAQLVLNASMNRHMNSKDPTASPASYAIARHAIATAAQCDPTMSKTRRPALSTKNMEVATPTSLHSDTAHARSTASESE